MNPAWHDPDVQQREWDWHWSHRAERRTVNAWKDRRHAEICSLLQALGLPRPDIVDVGCGSGHYTRGLARFGPTLGIDLSATAIEVARAEHPEARFEVADIYRSPLPEAAFDVVVAQEVFDHVPDQPGFLARAAALLRPRGHLLLSCTNRFVFERLRPGDFPPEHGEHVCVFLTPRELRRVLRPRFEVLRLTTVLPMGQRGVLRIVNSTRLARWLGAVVGPARLDAAKERLGCGYQIIALARRRD